MSQQAEGSRAMNVYIIICFALAAVALVAFKVTNDQREVLAEEYTDKFQKVADIQGGLVPNIRDYYQRVRAGQIYTVNKAVKDKTHERLREIAEKWNIKEATGDADRLDINPDARGALKFNEYYEFGCTVVLKNVTQSEWATFLRTVLDPYDRENLLDDYVTVASIEAVRRESNYRRLVASKEGTPGSYQDHSVWNVTVRFIWFASKEDVEAT